MLGIKPAIERKWKRSEENAQPELREPETPADHNFWASLESKPLRPESAARHLAVRYPFRYNDNGLRPR
jgi:hypothetical protein